MGMYTAFLTGGNLLPSLEDGNHLLEMVNSGGPNIDWKLHLDEQFLVLWKGWTTLKNDCYKL